MDDDFPTFQTVEWWIKELKEFDPKAIVMIATGPLEPPKALASIYYAGKRKLSVWIDVE